MSFPLNNPRHFLVWYRTSSTSSGTSEVLCFDTLPTVKQIKDRLKANGVGSTLPAGWCNLTILAISEVAG